MFSNKMLVVQRKGRCPAFLSATNDVKGMMKMFECSYAVNNFLFDDRTEALVYAVNLKDRITCLISPKTEGVCLEENATRADIERWL